MFFFNDTATPEIYTLSLHDPLPIYRPTEGASPNSHDVPGRRVRPPPRAGLRVGGGAPLEGRGRAGERSEEHTSELQSQSNHVCRLLLEKKKNYVLQTSHASF